jgi:hypothetical protein
MKAKLQNVVDAGKLSMEDRRRTGVNRFPLKHPGDA